MSLRLIPDDRYWSRPQRKQNDMDARTVEVIGQLVNVMLKSGIDENLIGEMMDELEQQAAALRAAGHPVDADECQAMADEIETVIKGT